MTTRYALTNIPYTLKDIQLGSLIPSIHRPNQDTFGPNRRLREGTDYRWRDEKNPDFVLATEDKGSVKADLTRFLRFWGEKSQSQNKELTATESRIYELTEPKTLFRSLVKGSAGRTWLNRTRDEGEDIHFIVGYRTYVDASMKDHLTSDMKAGGSAQAPVGVLSGDPIAATDSGDSALDPKLEAELSRHRMQKDSSNVPGERIYALNVRRVRFDWFKSKDAKSERLEKDNCWVVTSIRGTDEVDAVEVDFDVGFEERGVVIAVSQGSSEVFMAVAEDV